MIKLLLAFCLVVNFTPVLTQYEAVDLHIANKHRVSLSATWSEPLPVRYYMWLEVTFNTGSESVTQGYFELYDAGTTGTVFRAHTIGADWTVASYQLLGSGEYVE